MALAQFHAEGRLLYVEGARSRGDQHQVTYSHAALDQVDPGRTRVNENPIPALADQQLDCLDGGIDLEQFRVLRLATTGPPAGEALLRIEIEQGHSPTLLRGAHGKRTADRGLAHSAFGVGKRDDAQSRRLLGSHVVPDTGWESEIPEKRGEV